ncbi:MAG: PQQ-binding-like beta-propeller repeat protein [Opitutaceae bacterium]|nr:PQQ-binding-like beta-propeller repeat protein [Opitutaceae bacterium]
MLGGRPDRNNVSRETGLPADWNLEEKKGPLKNVKWIAALGKTTWGSPVVAGGRVFIGTDSASTVPTEQRGVLMCFAEADGKLLWSAAHDKLPSPSQDDGSIGLTGTPCVAGDRVYYVSNRAELVCRHVADGKEVWSLDLRAKVGVLPNQASSSSPLVVGDLVFVVTGHGVDHKTGKIKDPAVPSFLAVNRHTGAIAWQDNSPGAKILTGQWGSPGYGVVAGVPQVAFPGGDGWMYAFEPATGKLLWKFNGKAHEKASADGEPATQFQFVAAPVFVGDRVFAAIGEPEASTAAGALRCLDATQRGDVTRTAEVWRADGELMNDSISMPAVHGGLVFAADAPGYLSCFDAAAGARLWQADLKSNIWGSPLVADGKVYVQGAEGNVLVFAAAREKKLIAALTIPDGGHGTLVAANGVLYLTGQKRLYAISAAR